MKIFYGCSGEGLGHVSRTLAVVDQLSDVEVHIFTFGKAYKYLQTISYPWRHKIDGIMWSYKNSRIDYYSSAWTAYEYFTRYQRRNVRLIKEACCELQPQLFISDFEPSLARAAHACNKPLLSVDNQHCFAYRDVNDLPSFLSRYNWLCGSLAQIYVPRPEQVIISTFYADLLRAENGAVLTGGLLRKDVESIRPTQADHVLVYVRDSVSDGILACLESLDYRFKVYGARPGATKDRLATKSNFEFCELSPEFVRDLASCRKLVSTAGNQLITEARYYGKTCLLVPEPGQYEQTVNAFYAERLGMAKQFDLAQLTVGGVKDFLESFENRSASEPNGVHKIIEVVRGYL